MTPAVVASSASRLGLALAFLLSACAASHGIGADAGPDGQPADGPARDPCTTERGAEICGTLECPVERCWCVGGWTGAPPDALDFCEIGEGGGCAPAMGCTTGLGLCLDQLVDPRSWFLGACVSEAVCAELIYRGYPLGCRYGDGTLFETGVIRIEECPSGFDGIACGPACAPCDGGAACLGPSEHSGLGICHVGSFVPEGRCARTDTRRSCETPGDACLVLLAPRDEVFIRRRYENLGFCMATETCTELAAARPDRFECVPAIASP